MIVRAATEDDLPALRRLMQSVQDLHADAHPEVFRPTLDSEGAADFFAGLLANDHHLLLVAESAGNTIGYVWCEERQSTDSFHRLGAHTGYIHHVAVMPDHRRAGVGRQLIAEAIAKLKKRGATRVGVDFWSFNDRARAFFTGLGFAVEREVASRNL